jgi:hypothetical protein
MGCGPAEHGGRVGQRPCAGNALASRFETGNLRRCGSVAELIGTRKMAHQHQFGVNRWHRTQPRSHQCAIRRRNTEPVHPGIELEPATDRRAGIQRIEHGELAWMMDHGIDRQLPQQWQVGRFIKTRQQHNALVQADSAQTLGIAKRRHPKRIGTRQRLRNTLQAVAVPVSLDHRHHPRGRCAQTHCGQIMAQGIQIDMGASRAAHGQIRLETFR